jgi:hypothetical protein
MTTWVDHDASRIDGETLHLFQENTNVDVTARSDEAQRVPKECRGRELPQDHALASASMHRVARVGPADSDHRSDAPVLREEFDDLSLSFGAVLPPDHHGDGASHALRLFSRDAMRTGPQTDADRSA